MEFLRDPDLLYFNSANQSLLPRPVSEALWRYHHDYERNPSEGLHQAWKRMWEVQGALAHFLGADPQDLFLRSNVTSVLNSFLLGTKLPAGSEILAGELEYGAIVNICRMRAEREGLGLRVLKMPASHAALRALTKESLAEQVISQLGPRTKLLLLSHVLAGIGLVLPIAEIARETRKRGIFLVVDGAYAPGALAVDMKDLEDVDYYGCSLYKWMMGPKGTAFGWVAKRQQHGLRALNAGWTTFDTFGPFAEFGEGNRFQERFLMSGCHDFAPFRAISDTLAVWQTLGAEHVRAGMRSLQDKLEREITTRLGWRRLAAQAPDLRGPLLAFDLPAPWQAEGPRLLARLLTEKQVQINTISLHGRWYGVFSPHVCNTESEITELVDRLLAFRL